MSYINWQRRNEIQSPVQQDMGSPTLLQAQEIHMRASQLATLGSFTTRTNKAFNRSGQITFPNCMTDPSRTFSPPDETKNWQSFAAGPPIWSLVNGQTILSWGDLEAYAFLPWCLLSNLPQDLSLRPWSSERQVTDFLRIISQEGKDVSTQHRYIEDLTTENLCGPFLLYYHFHDGYSTPNLPGGSCRYPCSSTMYLNSLRRCICKPMYNAPLDKLTRKTTAARRRNQIQGLTTRNSFMRFDPAGTPYAQSRIYDEEWIGLLYNRWYLPKVTIFSVACTWGSA